MKTFFRLLLLSLGIGIIYYGWKNIPLQNIGSEMAKQAIYIQKSNSRFLEDWTNEDLLLKINTAREKSGFSKLRLNDRLSQSAMNRLAVILTEKDFEGNVTGLTRDLAVKNAGYEANLIGDLVLVDFFKSNDPIANWEADTITKGSLLHSDFRDIGIAIKNEQDKVSVYILLVSPRKIVPAPKKYTWGGPDLWTAVNERRVELGVNPLKQKEELCTIASIRLNQLLELGKLDGHAGFVPVLDRSDLKWISEKYNISEFLAQGYPTPVETVQAWENTMGHKALLAGGEYVWGCVYAQNTFAVAIAAY